MFNTLGENPLPDDVYASTRAARELVTASSAAMSAVAGFLPEVALKDALRRVRTAAEGSGPHL